MTEQLAGEKRVAGGLARYLRGERAPASSSSCPAAASINASTSADCQSR